MTTYETHMIDGRFVTYVIREKATVHTTRGWLTAKQARQAAQRWVKANA